MPRLPSWGGYSREDPARAYRSVYEREVSRLVDASVTSSMCEVVEDTQVEEVYIEETISPPEMPATESSRQRWASLDSICSPPSFGGGRKDQGIVDSKIGPLAILVMREEGINGY